MDANEFTNVDCVFIYNNPYDLQTDASYLYPNNNIEVIKNPNFDTLTKAIELLPTSSNRLRNISRPKMEVIYQKNKYTV